MRTLNSEFFEKKHEKRNIERTKKKDGIIKTIAYSLILIGLTAVISASYGVTRVFSVSSTHFAFKHIVFCLMSIFCLHLFSYMKKHLDIIGLIFWCASVAGLILVLFVSSSVKGASRWISLFGFSIQPSEFAKLGVMLQGAKYVDKDWKKFAATYLIPMLLIIIQPDLGNTVLISGIACAQIIVKRFNIKYIALGALSISLIIALAYLFLPHVSERIHIFLNPTADIFGAGYQRYKSLIAMQSGGWFGLGFGKGVAKDFLPDAHTDFIFSVIVEEFGIFGGLTIIALFATLGIRTLKLIAKDEYTKMIQYTFIICVLAQAWLNIASTLAIIPTKGLTLPLVSYGGSGMLMQGISFGIILATSLPKSNFLKPTKKGKFAQR